MLRRCWVMGCLVYWINVLYVPLLWHLTGLVVSHLLLPQMCDWRHLLCLSSIIWKRKGFRLLLTVQISLCPQVRDIDLRCYEREEDFPIVSALPSTKMPIVFLYMLRQCYAMVCLAWLITVLYVALLWQQCDTLFIFPGFILSHLLLQKACYWYHMLYLSSVSRPQALLCDPTMILPLSELCKLWRLRLYHIQPFDIVSFFFILPCPTQIGSSNLYPYLMEQLCSLCFRLSIESEVEFIFVVFTIPLANMPIHSPCTP